MSNLTDLARRLNRMGRSDNVLRLAIGEVVGVEPLTVQLLGGEILAAKPLLTLTASAAARYWETGDRAAALISKSGVLLLDKVV